MIESCCIEGVTANPLLLSHRFAVRLMMEASARAGRDLWLAGKPDISEEQSQLDSRDLQILRFIKADSAVN